MSVHALWDDLLVGGWQQLSQWRVDLKPEGLHLDFKQAGLLNDDVRPNDRKNLAKGISGFANVEGGLLVFGAETTHGPAKQDVLKALPGVTLLDRYAERLRVHVKDSTMPPVPGVEVKEFANPTNPTSGIVVVRIPLTDGVPYRAEGPNSDVSGRYFMRTTSDTVLMPHQVLAAMFGRRPSPQLRFGVERHDGRTLLLHVENVGRGAAVAPFVRLKFNGRYNNVFEYGSWQNKTSDVSGAGWKLAFALPVGDLIYPGESRNIAAIDVGGNEPEFTVRLDCENAHPIEVSRRVTIPKATIVWLEEPTI